MKLKKDFYLQTDVVSVARELLGKYLFTRFREGVTGGIITETEAYKGINDRASHAYNNRRTDRTATMFRKGGICYIYLCYGIHHLFNIVTNRKDIPDAILIRGLLPAEGIDLMQSRASFPVGGSGMITGPGRVSKVLGITTAYNGEDITANKIWIEERGIEVKSEEIDTDRRIGVDYAGEDSSLPYRFIWRGAGRR